MTTLVLVSFIGKDNASVQKLLSTFKTSIDVETRVLGDFSGEDAEVYGKLVKTRDTFQAKARKEVQSTFKFGAN